MEFIRKTKFQFSVRWEGCAILSKAGFPLDEFKPEKGYHTLLPKAPGIECNRPRYLTTRVQLPNRSEFFLTCIHLIHKYSDLRHGEVVRISEDLHEVFDKEHPQLWMGDFNTLCKADYSLEEWLSGCPCNRQCQRGSSRQTQHGRADAPPAAAGEWRHALDFMIPTNTSNTLCK